jgi:phosphoribosylformylglycinamidine synthase
VTDNVGKTATEAIELLVEKRKPLKVYTSRQYVIQGKIGRNEAERIASGVLANDLIERYEIVEGAGWDAKKGMKPYVPKVTGADDPRVEEIDLNVPDTALMEISSRGTLALSLEEMKAIQAHINDPAVIEARKRAGLGDKITDVELEVLAQTWSEHCKHKIFNSFITYEEPDGKRLEIDSLFSTCIKGSTKEIRERLGADDWCFSVFVDNAGVIKFNDDWNLVFKVETHNSPSALDPYGGALTGIVGVNRDPFGTGMGSRLIFNTDVFCFADPFYD